MTNRTKFVVLLALFMQTQHVAKGMICYLGYYELGINGAELGRLFQKRFSGEINL